MNINNFIDTTFDDYYLNPYKFDFIYKFNNYNENNFRFKSSNTNTTITTSSLPTISTIDLNDNENLNLIIKTLTSIIMSDTKLNDYTNNNIDKLIIFKYVANNQIDELKKFFLNNNNGTYDINIQDNDGDTALHIAIFLSNFEACEILIKNDANLFVKDKWGQVPLHRICFALENKNIIKIIELIDMCQKNLINNKFDKNNIFNSVDKFNNTPLHLVLKYIMKNKLKLNKNIILIIKKLKALTNINIENNDCLTVRELLELLNTQL